jgi:hypothetical protein
MKRNNQALFTVFALAVVVVVAIPLLMGGTMMTASGPAEDPSL